MKHSMHSGKEMEEMTSKKKKRMMALMRSKKMMREDEYEDEPKHDKSMAIMIKMMK